MAINILQPATWTSGNAQNKGYPDRQYSFDAFGARMMAIWGQTPYRSQVRELAFYRALTCYYRKGYQDIQDRRRLLYYYLWNEFSTESSEDALRRLAHQLPIQSIIPKALRNLCIAYSTPPSRRFGTESDPDLYNDSFQHVYDELAFDRYAQDIYRLAKLCNTVAVRPWLHPMTGEMRLQVLTPDVYRVEVVRGEPVELWYETTYAGETAIRVWNAKESYLRSTEGQRIKSSVDVLGQDTEFPNRYGRLPYAFLSIEPSLNEDPYGGSMYDLLEYNLRANKADFSADVGRTMNAFGVWVATNTEMNEKNLAITPDKIIVADGVTYGEGQELPPEIEHVVGSGMFGDVREDARRTVRDGLRLTGLPASLTDEEAGMPQSGISRVIERTELLEQRDADKLILKEWEAQFADLLSVVARTDGYDVDLPDPEQLWFGIDYAEERVFLEPSAEYDLQRRKAENGDSSLEEYARRVMGVDEADEEAIAEMIRQRRKIWKEAQKTEQDDVSASMGFQVEQMEEDIDTDDQSEEE